MSIRLTRSRLILVGALLIAGYFSYTALVSAARNQELTDEQIQMRDEVYALAEQRQYLEGIRDYVSTDEYIESEARTRLGWVREGEIPYIVVSPPEEEQSGTDNSTWWGRLFPR